MNYRKNFWYILGLGLVLLSVVIMAISMIFMYYGSDKSILWFFGSCPIIVIGVFLMRGTARRYDEADLETGEPLPAFWQIRYALHNLRVLVITHDIWRTVLTIVTIVVAVAAVVLSTVCVHSKLSVSATKKDPTFIQNTNTYEMSRSEWEKARKEGDTEAQKQYFDTMQNALEDNYKYRERIKNYEERFDSVLPYAVLSAAAAIFLGITLSAYIKFKASRPNQSIPT